MPQKIKGFLQYAFFLAIGIFLVLWSVRQIPNDKWPEFTKALAEANYWLAIPVFFVLSGSHVLRAWRWQILIAPLGYKPSLRNTFFAVMIGYLANLAVPRLGEVLKCTILTRYEKIPTDKLVGTIVAERAFDVVCLGIVFVLALVFQYDIVITYIQELLDKSSSAAQQSSLGTKLLIAIVFLLLLTIGGIWLVKKHGLAALRQKLTSIALGIWSGLTSASNLQHKWGFFVSTFGIWILYVGGTWLGFKATQGSNVLGIEVAFTGLAFGSVGMIITPGGIGSYALFLAEAMERNGVAFELGYANGTLQWIAQFVVVLVVGFLSMLLLPMLNKQKAHENHS